MLANSMCRVPGPCTTLLTVCRYYPPTLSSHGKPFLLLSNPVLQKCNITSTRHCARVHVLKNYENSPPASTRPELFPKHFQNDSAAKIILVKLKSSANPANSDPELCLPTRDALTDRIRLLKLHGISQDRIKFAPHLLLRDFDELEALANDIARILNVPFLCAIPLTNIPIRFWKRVSREWRKEVNELDEFKDGKFRNRMEYLADRLKLSTEDIAYLISRNVQISLHPISSLNSNIEILIEAGVRSEDIYRDPYILIHVGSAGMIQLLKINQEYQNQNERPWMLRGRECYPPELEMKQGREMDILVGRSHSRSRRFHQNEITCMSPDVDHIVPKIHNLNIFKVAKISDAPKLLTPRGHLNEDILKPRWIEQRLIDQERLEREKIPDIGLGLNVKAWLLLLMIPPIAKELCFKAFTPSHPQAQREMSQ